MINKRTSFILILLLYLSQLLLCTSYAWTGKVVAVTDGDTIKVLHDGKQEKIRLYGIDTPEKKQDFGKKAKKFTADMVAGQVVRIEPETIDRYGRTIAMVYKNKACLNEELIKAGLAWVYKEYCEKDICQDWCKLETEAREKKLGLWRGKDPMPPWEFRKRKREKK